MTPVNSELTELLSPPRFALPHVTTEPSDFNAANALLVEKISVTFELKLALTELLSPPWATDPHVMTEPSDFTAANAVSVEYISITPVNSELTELLSPPWSTDLHCCE